MCATAPSKQASGEDTAIIEDYKIVEAQHIYKVVEMAVLKFAEVALQMQHA